MEEKKIFFVLLTVSNEVRNTNGCRCCCYCFPFLSFFLFFSGRTTDSTASPSGAQILADVIKNVVFLEKQGFLFSAPIIGSSLGAFCRISVLSHKVEAFVSLNDIHCRLSIAQILYVVKVFFIRTSFRLLLVYFCCVSKFYFLTRNQTHQGLHL